MFFQIVPATRYEGDAEGFIRRRWVLRQGTEKNPGEAVAQSYAAFPDEAAARSDIAAARKAFAGARFAKVA